MMSKKKKKFRRHSASSADTQLRPNRTVRAVIDGGGMSDKEEEAGSEGDSSSTSCAVEVQFSHPSSPRHSAKRGTRADVDMKNFALDANPSHESIGGLESEEDASAWDVPSPPDSPDTKHRRAPSVEYYAQGRVDIIKLNVGGVLFSTSRSTLQKDPDSMLAAMFSGRFKPMQDADGCYFIDRDGTHFRHILNYLRDGLVYLPEGDMQMRQQLLAEAQYYQLYGLIETISGVPKTTKKEYLTIRYLPASTYDGWPVRIEGPLESYIIQGKELNGGSMPPERDNDAVRNMYGQAVTGWKLRGIFLTKIFNIIAKYGWVLCTSNGSGGGKTRNFAEMYVFSRYKSYRRMKIDRGDRRQSTSYQYSHIFPPTKAGEDELIEQSYVNSTVAALTTPMGTARASSTPLLTNPPEPSET